MKESDLYPPLKQFLEGQGYEVKGEIQNCDVIAVRGDEEPVIVELKLSLNLNLLLQAVDRLALSPDVYVAVPVSVRSIKQQKKRITKLFRMLGLGLIVIDPDASAIKVQVLLDPGEYKPRESKHRKKRLLGEFVKRVGDPNLGGISKKSGLMTAYRQQALAIAQYLTQQDSSKASDIAKALGNPKARDILYRNFYGWFDRVSRGVYQLSPKGEKEVKERYAQESVKLLDKTHQ